MKNGSFQSIYFNFMAMNRKIKFFSSGRKNADVFIFPPLYQTDLNISFNIQVEFEKELMTEKRETLPATVGIDGK